jgi:hypothetical protein
LINRAITRVAAPGSGRVGRARAAVVVSALLPIALAAPIAYLAGRIIA